MNSPPDTGPGKTPSSKRRGSQPTDYMILNSCQRKESYSDRATALKQMIAFKKSGKCKTRSPERRGELRPITAASAACFILATAKGKRFRAAFPSIPL